MGEDGDTQLIQQLSRTSLYWYYERAFSAATGMPLALRGVEHWQMALHGKESENPNLRVSEIAYEVGFQSLTHFNRMFRKLTGQSPSAYREALPVGR